MVPLKIPLFFLYVSSFCVFSNFQNKTKQKRKKTKKNSNITFSRMSV
uniref:Uncharacterized protein n=1 Tax=Anguilla anguilla TaxID=7936 RepID=A0A0E9T614_ANGAN